MTIQRVSPTVKRVLAPNPSPWTLEGTNTYIVGGDETIVIDPGPQIDSHIDAITQQAGRVSKVVVTHRHSDHAEAAEHFAARVDAPLFASGIEQSGERHTRLTKFQPLTTSDQLVVEDITLEVVSTPGHSSDHIALLHVSENALFSGDHVLGRGTTVVVFPDGDMAGYMDSLEVVIKLAPSKIFPGHGPIVDNPTDVLKFYREHRLEREQKVIKALTESPGELDDLLAVVYADVAKEVLPAAGLSLRAHLDKLVTQGRAKQEDGRWSLV